jgi:sphinganine-1-phosphate aldolase
MFKTQKLRRYAYYSISNWNGGLYGTGTLAGSRSSAPLVGAWIAMLYHGKEKY